MAWIESHQSLATNKKTWKAARLLGISDPQLVGHLHYLWWWSLDNSQDGDLSNVDVEEIERAAMWGGDPGRFVDTLVEVRFLERDEDGLRIHDWYEYAGKLLAARNKQALKAKLYNDLRLTRAVRARDGDTCQYCGKKVNWKDRKGAKGGTYDHINPDEGNTAENVVVSCRACSAKKGGRAIDQAHMSLIGEKPHDAVKSATVDFRQIIGGPPAPNIEATGEPQEQANAAPTAEDAPIAAGKPQDAAMPMPADLQHKSIDSRQISTDNQQISAKFTVDQSAITVPIPLPLLKDLTGGERSSARAHARDSILTPPPDTGDNDKGIYGIHGWVKLTIDEFSRLVTQYGAETVEKYIDIVDEKVQLVGNKRGYKDWFLLIRRAIEQNWSKDFDGGDVRGGGGKKPYFQRRTGQREYDEGELDNYISNEFGLKLPESAENGQPLNVGAGEDEGIDSS